jgi:hypothetical protein
MDRKSYTRIGIGMVNNQLGTVHQRIRERRLVHHPFQDKAEDVHSKEDAADAVLNKFRFRIKNNSVDRTARIGHRSLWLQLRLSGDNWWR